MPESLNLPEIELLSVASLQELAASLPRTTPWFTLLLVSDEPAADPETLARQLRPLVDSGLAYLCTWGQGCEELHDAVDAIVAQKEQAEGPLPYTLMSTWHSDEPLGEAVSYFCTLALPSEPEVFANFSRYAVAVGSPELTRRLRQALLRQGIAARNIGQ
jgi:hypothetical protein